MNTRHFSIATRRLATFAVPVVSVAVLWASVAIAQPTNATNPTPTPTTPAAPRTSESLPAGFQSALDGYKPYTDEKIVNWKAANDSVGQIGGWRAYAKEAREPDAAAGNAASTATGQGGKDAKPEPAKSGAGSHMGHGGKP